MDGWVPNAGNKMKKTDYDKSHNYGTHQDGDATRLGENWRSSKAVARIVQMHTR